MRLPPSSIDSTATLTSVPGGNVLPVIGARGGRHLGVRHQSDLPGAEPDEDAERLDALDGAGDDPAGGDLRLDARPGGGALRRQREADAPPAEVDPRHEHHEVGAGLGRPLHLAVAAAGDLGEVQEAVDAGPQLDEDAEVGHAHHSSPHDLAIAQGPGTAAHGSPSSAFRLRVIRPRAVSTASTFTVTDSPTRRRSAGLSTRECEISETGTRPCRPAEVHEGAEVGQGGHGPRKHRARDELLARLLGCPRSLLLEQRPAAEDDVPAVLVVARDAELEDPAHQRLGVVDAVPIHLGEGAERAQPRHRHLVAALDDEATLPSTGRPVSAATASPCRAWAPAIRRWDRRSDVAAADHGRLDGVAHRHREVPLGVHQLGPVDQRLALAADVDEDGLVVDVEDSPRHDLSHLDRPPRLFAGEQRRKVLRLDLVLRITHLFPLKRGCPLRLWFQHADRRAAEKGLDVLEGVRR